MWANIYVVSEQRGTSLDQYTAAGSVADAFAEYRAATGRPGEVSEKRDVDGHQVWVLDRDHSGAGYIAQYKVLIQEVIEDPRAPDAS